MCWLDAGTSDFRSFASCSWSHWVRRAGFDSSGVRAITIMTVSLGLSWMLVFMLMVLEAPGGLRLQRYSEVL